MMIGIKVMSIIKTTLIASALSLAVIGTATANHVHRGHASITPFSTQAKSVRGLFLSTQPQEFITPNGDYVAHAPSVSAPRGMQPAEPKPAIVMRGAPYADPDPFISNYLIRSYLDEGQG